MDDKKNTKILEMLSIASLISEGEFDSVHDNVLRVPFDRKKLLYLAEIIKDNNLKPYIDIEVKKGQFNIHSHTVLNKLREQWYSGQKKIFSMVLNPELITIQSIILAINLFGLRKLESISIPTNIDKVHLRAISYCIEYHLKVPVIPSITHVKITNVPKIILNCMKDIPAIHSAELVNFLTDKEKKKIMEETSK